MTEIGAPAEPLVGNDEKGMPLKQPYENMNPAVVYPIMNLVLSGLGTLIVWILHALAYSDPDSTVQIKLKVLRDNGLGLVYLSVCLLSQTVFIQQVFVAVGRKAGHVDNPDQYVYEVVGRSDLPYVRLVADGLIGEFNRAQRGIDNTREGFPIMVANVIMVGYLHRYGAFGATVAFLLGRFLYSRGYVKGASGRMGGQALTMLVTLYLNAFMLYTALVTTF